MSTSLPIDSAERKTYPIYNGVFGYFPAAIAGVAHHSYINNEKHNPGALMHWSMNKSTDHADCVSRHLLDLGEMLREYGDNENAAYQGMQLRDPDPLVKAILAEANALSWRSLALSQTLHMRLRGAPTPFNGK